MQCKFEFLLHPDWGRSRLYHYPVDDIHNAPGAGHLAFDRTILKVPFDVSFEGQMALGHRDLDAVGPP